MYKDNNNKAIKGESYIYQKLINNGIKARWTAFENRMAREDFITEDGTTIDVKIAYPRTIQKNATWYFNMHHHNKKQIGIDFYICIAMPDNIFVLPSSLLFSKTFRISERQLSRGKYDYFLENWDLIKYFKKNT